MFTGSTKSPPPKTPQPERLDEVYAALRRGLQSYLQVHQLELDSLGQQIRENKRNGRLGFLYEQDKQVKAIERFMRRLEFHLSKVEELYDAYCIQRRLRDGASKMVAAFNSATGSKEARESLSEANKGYKECTEHMCSLESELESQMGEFHIKMKGLAGFARLCAGDQYEVLMRYGRQRWRLRGRVEVSSKQVWDSEDNIFLPLITELLSIKVTELKSLANHVVVGSVSCETLDLFSPLPQTVAVDINDLGTVKLNLEVTWSPFDKDDQASSTSTVSKRLLSNHSPPDTPSMREQVFYNTSHGGAKQSWSLMEVFHETMADKRSTLPCDLSNTTPRIAHSQSSLLKRQGELDNGTVWSNSSESSDDSSSPAMAHQAHRLTASHTLQTNLTTQNLFTPHQSSTSTPSLSSNQEEDEPDTGEGFCEMGSRKCATPNGHLQSCTSDSHIGEINSDCTATDRASVQSVELSETSEDLSYSHCDVSSHGPVSVVERPEALPECGVPEMCPSAQEGNDGIPEASALQAENVETEASATELGPMEQTSSVEHNQRDPCTQEINQPGDLLTGHLHRSSRFSQEVETALESFDFLNCSDLDEEAEEGGQKEDKVEEVEEGSKPGKDKYKIEEEEMEEQEEQQNEELGKEEERDDKEEQKKHEEQIYTDGSDEEDEGLEIFIEAPEGFRNSDEDYHSQSEVASMEDLQELGEMKMSEVREEDNEEKGQEGHGEETSLDVLSGEETSHDKDSRPSTPNNMATTVL